MRRLNLSIKGISPFNYATYRDYLSALISAKESPRGIQSKIADAMGCHRSFLSQVISGATQITPDHAANVCEALNLKPEEAQYFVAMVNYERAGSPSLKRLLRKEMSLLKQTQDQLSKRLKKTAPTKMEMISRYYSAWYYSAIHVLLSLPGYSDKAKIGQRLHLSLDLVGKVIDDLLNLELITVENGNIRLADHHMHLDKLSPYATMYHGFWRERAMLDSALNKASSVHFTSVMALSRADAEKVKEVLLQTIEHIHEISKPSQEEELVCFNCDFFSV